MKPKQVSDGPYLVHRRLIPVDGSNIPLLVASVPDQGSGSAIDSMEIAKVGLTSHDRQGC
jgi:hypothetical protein